MQVWYTLFMWKPRWSYIIECFILGGGTRLLEHKPTISSLCLRGGTYISAFPYTHKPSCAKIFLAQSAVNIFGPWKKHKNRVLGHFLEKSVKTYSKVSHLPWYEADVAPPPSKPRSKGGGAPCKNTAHLIRCRWLIKAPGEREDRSAYTGAKETERLHLEIPKKCKLPCSQ